MKNRINSSNRVNARRQLRRGFSLLEVIVAVTIIALFAALIAPNLLRRLGGAKRDQAQIKASAISAQMKTYLAESRETSLGEDFNLDVLVTAGYLESMDDLLDPWGNRYVVLPGTEGRDFDVVSYGSDGEPGGEEGSESADIIGGKDARAKKRDN
jgi:general secretion pathway protein G